jgi:hypothetical protein
MENIGTVLFMNIGTGEILTLLIIIAIVVIISKSISKKKKSTSNIKSPYSNSENKSNGEKQVKQNTSTTSSSNDISRSENVQQKQTEQVKQNTSTKKELTIKELKQTLENGIDSVIQNTIREYNAANNNGSSMESRAELGFAITMDLFQLRELVMEEYTKIRHDLGLTKEEIEAIIDNVLSDAQKKYTE